MAAIYSDLADKVVLVTGGAAGIGAAIVRKFAEQKSKVVFFDIKVEEGQRLARTFPRCERALQRRARPTARSTS